MHDELVMETNKQNLNKSNTVKWSNAVSTKQKTKISLSHFSKQLFLKQYSFVP